MKTEYYYVDMYNVDYGYWLRKNLEAWSKRLTGQGDCSLIIFSTREGLESFVRDVFADYCEDVASPQPSYTNGDVTTEYRRVEDGTTVECDDGGLWTLTRRVECRTIQRIRTRKEVVVDGETYSRNVVEEQHSEWSPYEHPDRVTLYTSTRVMHII